MGAGEGPHFLALEKRQDVIDPKQFLSALSEKDRLAIIKDANAMKFTPTMGPQADAYFSKADVLLYGGSAGSGKRLDNRTLVPVPIETDKSGFKKHGDLCVGDYVYGPDGQKTQVLAISDVVEDTEAYELEFDSGEKIIADGDHLWHTFTQRDRIKLLRCTEEWRAKRRAKRKSRAVSVSKKPWVSEIISKRNSERVYDISKPTGSVRTTREIALTLEFGKHKNHSIDCTKPILNHDLDLPIDPYLFGLWLGDGWSSAGRIGKNVDDFEEILTYLPEPKKRTLETKNRETPFLVCSFEGLQSSLRSLGVLGKKHIPPIYLRASQSQRLALLQGMLDTDGYCSTDGSIEVGFSNKELADGLLEIVSSLGLKASLHEKDAKDQHGNGKTHYRMTFSAPFYVFRLSKKRDRQKIHGIREVARKRYIVNARRVKSVPMRCIRVDSDDGLYLVGKTFITTHNSALLSGLCLTSHKRSLLVRRHYGELRALIEDVLKFNGGREGFSGSPPPCLRTLDGRLVEFGACQYAGDESKFQGSPHDFIGFDEAVNLLESQVRFLLGWLRTTDEKQRCRAVLATNPPTTSDGDWIIGFFRPWLDLTHPNPAKAGELRWYVTAPDGTDLEVDGPEPVILDGQKLRPTSRSFIPAKLSDNPYLSKTDYAARLDALPEPLRSAIRDGNFMLAREDDPWQCIPTDWVMQAVARWTPNPPADIPMCSIGVDCAQGGSDKTVLAIRYDAWFSIEAVDGSKTPHGRDIAGLVVGRRRDNAAIILDMGGGYGGGAYECLRANNIDAIPYKGGEGSTGRSKDGTLRFKNKRTQAYWRFREALDPSQQGGSGIALPNIPELIADLTAPRFSVPADAIVLETKESVCERLGRSTDYGDAIVMSFMHGDRMATKFMAHNKTRPQVISNKSLRK